MVGHWLGLPLVLLVLGLVSVALLIGMQRIREELIDSDSALVRSLNEIQTDLATAHLWVEEYVTGDEVLMAPVWRSLDEAHQRVLAMLGRADAPERLAAALREPVLVAQAERIRSSIERFRDISHQRHAGYDTGDDVGIGSEIDVEYDRVFGQVFRETESLKAAIGARLAQSRARTRMLFRIILLAWVMIVGLAVAALWNRERRRALAEEALQASQLQLLQAQKLEAVGRLAGGLAHDINNYLGAMTSQCEVVRLQAESDSALGEQMKTVIGTAFKASALIRRLLAFSRQQPTQPQVIRLDRVIADLDPMLHQLIGEDVQLEYRSSGDLWPVKVDPAQLEQVVVNLVVNARDAMPTGGTVTLRTANCLNEVSDPGGRHLAAGAYVSLTVTDTGPGVPPTIRDKVFEPFFTTKDKSQGSGLGLATVYGIIEQHGGQVWVEDAPGGTGAAFNIFLPRSAEAPAARLERSFSHPAEVGGGRVLVVEDNPEMRASTAAIVSALGYEVAVAADGHEALRMFHAGWQDIALLITDVVMPDMSGKELSEKLLAKRPDLPVLFVSGYTDDVVLRHGITEGEVEFLEKPFAAAQLAQKMRQLIANPTDG